MRKIVSLLILFLVFSFTAIAQVDDSDDNLENEIKELEGKISESQSQQRTLSSQIGYMNSQIKLTTLRITETTENIEKLGKDIEKLSGKIEKLEISLTDLSSILIQRVVTTYKNRKSTFLSFLFASDNIGDFIKRGKYIATAQAHDKKVMFELQETKATYGEQKDLREGKKTKQEDFILKLESQKKDLDNQKVAKAYLLTVTKNDEKKYQELLAIVRAEFEAIQAVLAGEGDENEIGDINEGDRIASVIQGTSCNSGGTHLHFTIIENDSIQSPFKYLKSIDYENCSGPGTCNAADPFNPSGSWNWPIEPKVRFNQGYGLTWAVQNTWVGQIYQSHNGIDINSLDSSSVKAVKSGTLFRGSYSGSSGCRLRYVKVEHNDLNMKTFYLHINY